MWRKKAFFILILAGISGCRLTTDEALTIESFYYDFRNDQHGWAGDFADYPIADSAVLDLTFSHEILPGSLHEEKGLLLSGDCKGESLFMFVKKRITGLKPSTAYGIGFDVLFVTNSPYGYPDNGNVSGDKVYLKAGAIPYEPEKFANGNQYKMNLDKGAAYTSGTDMVLIGNIASTGNYPSYSFESRSNSNSFTAVSNADGEIWLIVGTDTGQQGLTALYYSRIGVVLSAVP
jgi:hypothetical protein